MFKSIWEAMKIWVKMRKL